jgi:hypothetical protein
MTNLYDRRDRKVKRVSLRRFRFERQKRCPVSYGHWETLDTVGHVLGQYGYIGHWDTEIPRSFERRTRKIGSSAVFARSNTRLIAYTTECIAHQRDIG